MTRDQNEARSLPRGYLVGVRVRVRVRKGFLGRESSKCKGPEVEEYGKSKTAIQS